MPLSFESNFMERIPVKSLFKKRQTQAKRGQSVVEFLVVSVFFVFMLAMSFIFLSVGSLLFKWGKD